jgi:HD-GYP domain-containing protein (c-di-GMP phosphodiesterase class II)
MGNLVAGLDSFFLGVSDVEEYLLDEHNWISQEICAKLFERVRLYSGKDDIARSIGHESVLSRDFGYIEKILIKTLGSPYRSILEAPALNDKFNKTKKIEIVEADKTYAVIRLKWFKGLGSTRDICLYNQGIYEAMPIIWGLPFAKTVEKACFFKGDEYCEYVFNWTEKSHLKAILSFFSPSKDVLEDSIAEIEREKAHLRSKYLEIENLNKELERRIERLTSLNACSKATASILDVDILLDIVMSLIVNVMKFDRAVIMLVDEEHHLLKPVKGIGEHGNALEKIKEYVIPLTRTSNILARVVETGIAEVIRDVDTSFLNRDNIILRNFNPKSFAAMPLITRNKVIGVLAAERFKGLQDFTSNDLEYLMNFCSQIAISLENARLIDSMKQSFVSSILSLASALEAKDRYTHGHSNRVASYSVMIARELGFDKERIEAVRLMTLIHDIGKIGIPDGIINKPGKLTDAEFSIIKNHPNYGVRIITPLLVNNPDLKLVRSHHERYDGLGYPDALEGNKIPIEAQIIAISDTFDAMTSNRPYRSALSRERALTEIERNKGTQFSPTIADVFIKLISTMTEEQYSVLTSETNGIERM